MSGTVGAAVSRIDGVLKVTGAARYCADVQLGDIAHAVLACSTVASARILAMDTRAAQAVPGVLAVVTHLNSPRLHFPTDAPRTSAGTLRRVAVRAFEGDQVYFAGQRIALVVADTLEHATHAASLIGVTYEMLPARAALADDLDAAYRPESVNGNREPDTEVGNVERALLEAQARVDQTYCTPVEHHNPIELSSCTAFWTGHGEARELTLYDTTQGVYELRRALATTFQMPEERVRVVCPFLGGGFGGKFSARPHTALAAVAADLVGRPVKLVLTREQMFTSIGHRPASVQRVRLGATGDGRLTAVSHDAIMGTATHEEWIEQCAAPTRMMYACPNRRTTHRAVRLNLDTPTIMRAPGEAPGSFALESALDELAHELQIDPIELRLRNHAELDPESGKPWSSNSLRQCLRGGAERFGWQSRVPRPRSLRAGAELIGYGVACAARAVNMMPASARARAFADGTVEIATAAHDIGTGTYTILAQIAGDVLGLAPEGVRVELGDTLLPPAPPAGGSVTAASVGSAAYLAAAALASKIVSLAIADASSPLFGARSGEIRLTGGHLVMPGAVARSESLAALLSRNGYGPRRPLEADGRFAPPARAASPWSMYAFGAHFCEVRVDTDLGTIRIERMLGTYACGRVLNAKTARSQLIGGMVGGIGMALLEEAHIDRECGRIVNTNLADYLIPVHADIRHIDAICLDETDSHVNPLGAKGLGELPIVGVAAAVANAVFNATGIRVRDLPIRIEHVLGVES